MTKNGVRPHFLRKWGLTPFLLVLAVALVLGAPVLFLGDLPTGEGGSRWLESYGASAWLIGIGLLIADLAIPVPTTAVMSALGIVYGPWLGGLIAASGSIASGLAGYGLGRLLGRPLVVLLAGAGSLAEGERFFAGFGGWAVALSRWLPLVSEVVACLAGLSRMRFPVFAAALVCGSLPLGFVFAAIGDAGEDRPLVTLGLSALVPFALWALLRPLLKSRT